MNTLSHLSQTQINTKQQTKKVHDKEEDKKERLLETKMQYITLEEAKDRTNGEENHTDDMAEC